MKSRNNKRFRTLICIVCAMAVIILSSLAAVNITLAWIENNVNPAFQANEMQLATSPGLVMTIDGKQTDLIDLNAYLSDSKNKPFILSEMSSIDGKTLWVRETVSSNDVKLHLADDSDKNVSYIDFTLKLQAVGYSEVNDGKVDIYLGDSSDQELTFLETASEDYSDDALKPIRIYMSYSYTDPATKENVFGENIFAKDNSYQTMAIKTVDNTTGFVTSDPSDYALQGISQSDNSDPVINWFSDYYYSENDTSKKWLTLPDGVVATIRVKVWLEGCDGNWSNNELTVGNCIDQISGSELNMKITFFTPPVTTSTN